MCIVQLHEYHLLHTLAHTNRMQTGVEHHRSTVIQCSQRFSEHCNRSNILTSHPILAIPLPVPSSTKKDAAKIFSGCYTVLITKQKEKLEGLLIQENGLNWCEYELTIFSF